MNVAIFSYYYLPITNGVVLTIRDWYEKAVKQGDKATIFIPYMGESSSYPYVHAYPAIPLYRKFGITMPTFPEQSIEKVFALKSFDCIHVHHPFFIGSLALFFKKKYQVPLVYTYHTRIGDYIHTYFPFLSRYIVRLMIRILLVRFINQSDAVTVANQLLREELVRMGVKVPTYIVPPGVPTKIIASGNRLATRKKLRIHANRKVLLYVGRLAKEKNIYFLLKVFAKLYANDHTLVFLLAGNGLEEDRIRAFIKKHRLHRSVILTTHETPSSIADIYAAADMFMYASQTETYGRVLVEAMAARLPVVVLDAPAVIGIVKDHVNGRIVYKKTLKEFYRVVYELLGDHSAQRKFAMEAQKTAVTQHDSAISWKKLHAVYQAVLKAKQ